MNVYLAIVLVFSAVICQDGNNLNEMHLQSAIALHQMYGADFPPLPNQINPDLWKEFALDELLINPPGDPNYGSDFQIGITQTHSSVENSNPWVVAINDNGEHSCTGSILNKEWVITAAHCFPKGDPSNITLLVGSNIKTNGMQYRVARIVKHPRHDVSKKKNNDIALLKIDGQFEMSDSVYPIGLPSLPMEELPTNIQIMSTGWGKSSINAQESDHYLGEMYLTKIEPELCAKVYKSLGEQGHPVFKSQVCTWNKNQTVCKGNSGGPAVVYNNGAPVLVGTVSFGIKCADQYPVVFSKTSYFLTWIHQTMMHYNDGPQVGPQGPTGASPMGNDQYQQPGGQPGGQQGGPPGGQQGGSQMGDQIGGAIGGALGAVGSVMGAPGGMTGGSPGISEMN